ncbi:UDP-N-acetylglucosamine--N-acetylmuramyl-(pentapeptide) pyrophosphoryl-undecaprenol N-acetylglucosamine transferase [Amycolatopsis sp., V23-08]|uniref:UDP-N-acetylglucosamine--N-acetylmuramyl-(pentapeptide) pyrophosphoryl-undecaprenol N-acetylglucosamine transferase n=1 Tax=Amycolatopsis heterodermiae TaxID=3110235 RepID=A0ABU5RLM2_9PSEU|nr:UDP-N-acetylglucosamine--N-acetylmuramyl-(pentapeptide) pyrophosphoryl-undecaprenol N-acetylglucosamine transferase [Amycolatopsis sp., V23-08]MEA5367187.1 UDP-N-acetylglucosamine--N-acetylmuramyl-(pentapeptide) pyrophosphoryl-undecaprenol N-acetylglucosamine transferase [Amycolatopsis sp., V23-08]
MDAGSGSNGRGTRSVRLLVTGGGTGGHTYPALTAIRTLEHRFMTDQRPEVRWVGTAAGLEARTAEREGISFAAVAAGKIRRAKNPVKMLSWTNLKDLGKVPLGVVQAVRAVRAFRPDVVLATGGYVSVPVSLAAWACRRPLVVHEQTVRLGLANRLLARVASVMAVSSASTVPLLPERARKRAVVTGNPVRPEVLAGHAEKALDALALTGFDRARPTVYVTGGAQGATQINRLVGDVLPWLLEQANVIHQCGPGTVTQMQAAAERLPVDAAGRYVPIGFVGPELPDVFALADVVISRSGAGTIAELTALGLPSVLIPLASSAGGEQAHNARHLAESGAASALLSDVTAAALQNALEPLLADPARRQEMADSAREQGRPDAGERLVDVVVDLAKAGGR